MTNKHKKQTIVVASGYFDPLHSGHIRYFREAKKLGDKLIVIVNNDKQTKLKKGHPFMRQDERLEIVKAIKYVDDVFLSVDKDRTVVKSIMKIRPDIFAVGADYSKNMLIEKKICDKFGIKIVDRLARRFLIHPKFKQSSSKILSKYLYDKLNKHKVCRDCMIKLK